jgi:hypothetical protein
VADRSIPIVMSRKRAGEDAERLLRREVEPGALALHTRLAGWAADQANLNLLKKAQPDLPADLSDRAADGWEPLLAIAERARGNWPERARRAALALSMEQASMETSPASELLGAIQTVCALHRVDTLFTHDLIKLLALAEESKYEHWWDARENKPATGAANRLANKLRPFGIHSEDQRLGTLVRKGYRRHMFHDAWERHLPEVPGAAPSPSEVETDHAIGPISSDAARGHLPAKDVQQP